MIERKKWKKNETEVNQLIESRGVGASKYNATINEVIIFCKNYIKTKQKNISNGWKFAVDQNVIKGFDLFKFLDLVITIEDIGGNPLMYSGSGQTFGTPSLEDGIRDGQYLMPQEIRLYGYSHGTDLCERTILNPLYHELNHKIDDLYRADSKDKKTVNSQALIYQKVKKEEFSHDDNVNEAIHSVVYRVFSTSEMNALVSGVYGDLKGIGSERKNWRDDIIRTQAYIVYSDLMADYNILYYSNDLNAFAKLKQIFDGSVMQGYKIDISVEEFKKWFLTTLSNRIEKLYRNIGRAASLWYDDKEKPIDEHTPEICIDGEVMNTPLLENPDFQEYLKTFKRLCESTFLEKYLFL